jgi:hypothetical protein
MRKVAFAFAFVLLGCVEEAPTHVPALQPSELLAARRAIPKNYTAQISARQEVPPNASRSRGAAHFQHDATDESVSFRLIVANLDNVTQAHIHLGPAGTNGPVVVWLYPSGPPAQLIPGTTSGVLSTGVFTADNLVGPLAGGALIDLLNAMAAGNTYVNVHTTAFPPGEIRGQIRAGG